MNGETAEKLERFKVPGVDTILGVPYPVLDKGHVRLVDYMGGDEAVVQAARVSYGKGTKKVHEDRGLIRFLMRQHHTTPFEMCEVKLHVRVPMDHWRQWIRHRTACLTGDTALHFDLPGGIKRMNLTVKQIFDRFKPTKNKTRPDRQRNPHFKRNRVCGMRLRSVDEELLSPMHTSVVDIWESGVKPVYEITLENGCRAKMSKDHLCFTENGWMRLGSAVELASPLGWNESPRFATVSPKLGSGVPQKATYMMWDASEEWRSVAGEFSGWYEVSSFGRVRRVVGGKGSRSFGRCKALTLRDGHYSVSLNKPGVQEVRHVHYLALRAFIGKPENGQEGRHLNGNNLDNRIDNLAWGSADENAKDRVKHGSTTALGVVFSRVKTVRYVGHEMTYDLEVAGPFHNFVAGGMVVHNSVNEYSTRYSEAIDDTAKTRPDDWRLQSKSNKQGSTGFLDHERGTELTVAEASLHAALRQEYEKRLAYGVAKEQARKDLSLSTYTEAYWKVDLHNLLHFLRLRMDPHAQEEIRAYATVIGEEIVARWCPVTWEAFKDYRLSSMSLTRLDIEVIQAGPGVREILSKAREFGWLEKDVEGKLKSNRERDEFEAKVARLGIMPIVPWQ